MFTAEEKKSTGGQTALIQFQGQFAVQGDIFFILWKFMSKGKWKPVFKSAASPKLNNKHTWKETVLNTNFICNGDNKQPFRVDFLLAKDDGNHKLLGSKEMTIDGIQGGNKTLTMGSYKAQIVKFELKPVVNFLEYVFGGCKINLEVAIDFTASNGPQDDPNSLHSMFDERKN